MLDTRYWMLDTGCRMLVVTTPSTLQPFNPSTFQPFNLSTLQPFNLSTLQPFNLSTLQPFNPSTFQPFNLSTLKPCNDLTPATLLMDLTRKMKFNIGVVLYLGI